MGDTGVEGGVGLGGWDRGDGLGSGVVMVELGGMGPHGTQGWARGVRRGQRGTATVEWPKPRRALLP